MGVSDHVMEIDPVSCQKVSDAEMWYRVLHHVWDFGRIPFDLIFYIN